MLNPLSQANVPSASTASNDSTGGPSTHSFPTPYVPQTTQHIRFGPQKQPRHQIESQNSQHIQREELLLPIPGMPWVTRTAQLLLLMHYDWIHNELTSPQQFQAGAGEAEKLAAEGPGMGVRDLSRELAAACTPSRMPRLDA